MQMVDGNGQLMGTVLDMGGVESTTKGSVNTKRSNKKSINQSMPT